MRLCVHNYLLFRIDSRDAGIALLHAFTRRHFRTVVIRAIAFADTALGTAPIIRILREPCTNLRGGVLQSRNLFGSGFELLGLSGEIGARTTLVLGGIASRA